MEVSLFTLIAVAAILFLPLFCLVVVVKQYKRCPSNRILVVFGRIGGQKSSKCVHGGGTFVVPLLQDYAFLSLDPITIDIELSGATNELRGLSLKFHIKFLEHTVPFMEGETVQQ